MDERWQLSASVYSASLAQQMVWLSGLLPYAQCEAVFERIAQVHIPSSSIWRQTQAYGEKLQVHLEHRQAHVRPERLCLPPAVADHAQQKGISMDGGMVNIRGEGWKEFKVGTIFDVQQGVERHPLTQELVERPRATHIAYRAVLGSVEQFAPALWALAVEQDVPTARDACVTADGAEWIWNVVADYFPMSTQIIDWYHATQRLALAAKALFPDDESRRLRWFKSHCDALFQGQIWIITHALDAQDLSEHSRYFHVHQHRMQYLEFQEQGYPIGSGTVESGIKQFKTRLTAAGMRWRRTAAQQMLMIRASVLDEQFDHLWQLAA